MKNDMIRFLIYMLSAIFLLMMATVVVWMIGAILVIINYFTGLSIEFIVFWLLILTVAIVTIDRRL